MEIMAIMLLLIIPLKFIELCLWSTLQILQLVSAIIGLFTGRA